MNSEQHNQMSEAMSGVENYKEYGEILRDNE